MKNFTEITDLPVHDLYSEFNRLMDENIISWYNGKKDQICLNSTANDPTNIHLGRGSLVFNWDTFDPTASNVDHVEANHNSLQESDFSVMCPQFSNTLFEDVYRALDSRYILGRVRIIYSIPKKCMTWHRDSSIRIHYPMKTQEGCLMVIENEVKHLPQNTWWETNTLVNHTALNGSREERLHLVAAILGEK